MPDSLATDLIRRQEQLAGQRSTWESHWQEIADRVLPRQAEFVTRRPSGQKRTEKVFDATAPLALERFAAAMESMLTPRNARWHRLRTSGHIVNIDEDVRLWFDLATDLLFGARYAPGANYASQQHEVYMSLGAFGTGVLFVAERDVGGLFYKSIHLAECFLAENKEGRVDTNFRKFEMTARQAAQKWGEARLPEAMKRAIEKEPDRRFDFLHAVFPRTDRNRRRADNLNMPFASLYVAFDERRLISESGFEEFPYMVSRYVTAPREVYGRSPAMLALPDIKMINEMSKTVIRAAHKVVDPPILLSDDGVLTSLNMRPGALNFGGVNEQGQQLAVPLQTSARVDIGLDMMEARRRGINDAFLVTLFQVLTEAPSMTATEALIRAQEKGGLLGPTVGRQQSEALGPMIERELGIMLRARALPPMPDALIRAGGPFEIEYDSPLSRAQRSDDGLAILRVLEMVAPLAAADPSVMDNFDADAIARLAVQVNGAPQKILRPVEARDAIRRGRQEGNVAAAVLAAAPGVSRAVRDLAEAGATEAKTLDET